jgi:deoxyribodipyrimidine photo-lyase
MNADTIAPQVPPIRIDVRIDVPERPDGDYVLYWMTMFRRRRSNFALQRAVEWAARLKRPLLVLEALRCGYPHASDRLHAFILQGMGDNARAFADGAATYVPYVEPEPGAGKQLLATLAKRACVVVGDEFPTFMLPRMTSAAERQVEGRFELVDANGLLPMRAAPKEFLVAVDFRRFLQRELPQHLVQFPQVDPLAGAALPRLDALPKELERWPRAPADLLEARPEALARLPIDHAVGEGVMRGGSDAAAARLAVFLDEKLGRYPEQRLDPMAEATSRLSPYLHFGHISSHEVFAALAQKEKWTSARLAKTANGKREGWWGMAPAAEAFLDEIVTWRELAYNLCFRRPDDHASIAAVPEWARRTLAEHADDARSHRYTFEEFEAGRTHDPLWNAAHAQLVRDGWFHNRLRMLWAKKILEWSADPAEALATMGRLMNKYALCGRNPNAYAGYLWTLGRYDRPWGPKRPVLGTVRYMSSELAAKKPEMRAFMERYGNR